MSNTELSKTLSYILRHKPEEFNIVLDGNGWAEVTAVLHALHGKQQSITLEQLQEVVATSDKKRFSFNDAGTHVRANQGHSVAVDLTLASVTPPEYLFHGTATRFLDAIRQQGLLRGERQHVHLSPDAPTAVEVGRRHGKPTVLTVGAGAMHADGLVFFRAANGVWLTEHVPASYLRFE